MRLHVKNMIKHMTGGSFKQLPTDMSCFADAVKTTPEQRLLV